MRCAEISLAAGEPLAGTAVALTDRFLVLEHELPWGPKGVEDSGLPASVSAWLTELSIDHPRLRVQLTRRRERSGPPRVYFASSDVPALYALELGSPEELLTLDLVPWLDGEGAPPGKSESAPLYLVCVHGKRDRCCALLGLPVFRGLSERVGERALETTHLGGHRFAATLLVLPHGICYGRVEPSEVDALLAASERERFYDLARVRGRASLPPEAQAAEVALRTRTGELGYGAYAYVGSQRDDGGFTVRFRASNSQQEHEVRVCREAMPAMATSCGGEAKPVKRLISLQSD